MGPGWHPARLGSGACVWGQVWVRRPPAYAALRQPRPVLMTASRLPVLGPAPGQVQASGEGGAGRAGEAGLPALSLGPSPFAWHTASCVCVYTLCVKVSVGVYV